MAGVIRPALALAVLFLSTPALAQQPPPQATQEEPKVSDDVRLIRALAMYRAGRLDLAWAAWDKLAKEGNKEAAYVLRVLAPLKPIPE
jgi:hypothetical protein